MRQRCWESSRSSGVATGLARAICRDLWPLSFETCWKEWCSVVRCCSVACTVSVCPRQRTTAETGPDAAAQDGVDRRRPPRRTHVGLDLGERTKRGGRPQGSGARVAASRVHLRHGPRPGPRSTSFGRRELARPPHPVAWLLCTHSVFSYVSKTVTRTPAHGTQETPVDTDARWYERVDSALRSDTRWYSKTCHMTTVQMTWHSPELKQTRIGVACCPLHAGYGVESACSCLNSFGALLNLCLSCA